MAVPYRPFRHGLTYTVCALSLLSSCAGLPVQPTLQYENVVTAEGKAIDTLTEDDQAARTSIALANFTEGEGTLTLVHCASTDTEPCTVTYTLAGQPRVLRAAAPKVRALHDAIERYATQMHTLAEAKDLDTVKAKAEAAAASVKALAVVAGAPAIIAPIIDAAVFAANAGLREKRRRAMARVAVSARPAIGLAAKELTTITEQMRTNALEGIDLEMLRVKQRIGRDHNEAAPWQASQDANRRLGVQSASRLDVLRQRQEDDTAKLFALAEKMNRVRGAKIPFDKMVVTHEALIYALQNPKVSTEEALSQVNAVEAIIAQAFPKKPAEK